MEEDAVFRYNGGVVQDKSITNVIIEPGIVMIEHCAFLACKNLQSVTITEGVTEIGEGSFDGCESLSNVHLPQSLATIGPCAFSGCKTLREIVIPTGVKYIGPGAFARSGIVEINIPEGVTEIGASSFSGCESLRHVQLPQSLATIGDDAFSQCKSLRRVDIPKGVKTIGPEAFAKSGIEKIVIPDGIQAIVENVFFYCVSLHTVQLPKSVSRIHYTAFEGCGNFKNLMTPDGMPESIELDLPPPDVALNLVSYGTNAAIVEQLRKHRFEKGALHDAMANNSETRSVKLLLEANPAAAETKNLDGELALHLGLKRFEELSNKNENCESALEKILLVLRRYPGAAKVKDQEGYTPLLRMCMATQTKHANTSKSTTVMKEIFDANPGATEMSCEGEFPIDILAEKCRLLDDGKIGQDGLTTIVLENGIVDKLKIWLNVRDWRSLGSLCHLKDRVSLLVFLYLFDERTAEGSQSLGVEKPHELHLNLHKQHISGLSLLEIIADFDTEDSAEILLTLFDQLFKKDATVTIKYQPENTEPMNVEFVSVEALTGKDLIQVADRAKQSQSSEKLRKWGREYGRMFGRYRLDEYPKHVSDTCVVVFATEAQEVSGGGQVVETPVALKFMSDKEAFCREVENRRKTLPAFVVPIKAFFVPEQDLELACDHIDDKNYSVDLKQELSRFPNIARPCDKLYEESNLHLVVMERGGPDLHRFADDQNIAGKDLISALKTAMGVARSLRFLNETCGIVHGDVRPSNFVTRDDGQEFEFAAIDLVSAVSVGQEVTLRKRPISGYIPPEQAAVELYHLSVSRSIHSDQKRTADGDPRSEASNSSLEVKEYKELIEQALEGNNFEKVAELSNQAMRKLAKYQTRIAPETLEDGINQCKKDIRLALEFDNFAEAAELSNQAMRNLTNYQNNLSENTSLSENTEAGFCDYKAKNKRAQEDDNSENGSELSKKARTRRDTESIYVSPKYDMWSFGALLFYLCSGTHLFNEGGGVVEEHKDLIDITNWGRTNLMKYKLAGIGPGWPLGLLKKLLQSAPNDRPENWDDIIKELDELIQIVEERSKKTDRLVVLQADVLVYVDHENVPQARPRLSIEKEEVMIKNFCRAARSIAARIEVAFEAASVDEFSIFFARQPSQVLHLSCHGNSDYLALESRDGALEQFYCERLEAWVKARGKFLKLAVLSACCSKDIGETLFKAGVPHVVYCTANVSDKAAQLFSSQLYLHLAAEATISDAFDMAKETVAGMKSEIYNSEAEAKNFVLRSKEGASDDDKKIFFTKKDMPPLDAESIKKNCLMPLKLPGNFLESVRAKYKDFAPPTSDGDFSYAVCYKGGEAGVSDSTARLYASHLYLHLSAGAKIQQAFVMANSTVPAASRSEAKDFHLLRQDKDGGLYLHVSTGARFDPQDFREVDPGEVEQYKSYTFFSNDIPEVFLKSEEEPRKNFSIPPRLDDGFCGRETLMYQIITSWRDNDLVHVHGAEGVGKTSVVAAVCRYMIKRPMSFNMDRFCWLNPSMKPLFDDEADEAMGNLCSAYYDGVCNKARTGSEFGVYKDKEMRKLLKQDESVYLVIDEAKYETPDYQQNLKQFISNLLDEQEMPCKVKIILISCDSKSVGGIQPKWKEASFKVEPLDFDNTVGHFWNHLPSSCKEGFGQGVSKKPYKPLLDCMVVNGGIRTDNLIESLGNGIPREIREKAQLGWPRLEFINIVILFWNNLPDDIKGDFDSLRECLWPPNEYDQTTYDRLLKRLGNGIPKEVIIKAKGTTTQQLMGLKAWWRPLDFENTVNLFWNTLPRLIQSQERWRSMVHEWWISQDRSSPKYVELFGLLGNGIPQEVINRAKSMDDGKMLRLKELWSPSPRLF